MTSERQLRKRPRVEYNTNGQRVYCICRGLDDGTFMIQCDGCSEWYHGECLGLEEEQVGDTFECQACLGQVVNIEKPVEPISTISVDPDLPKKKPIKEKQKTKSVKQQDKPKKVLSPSDLVRKMAQKSFIETLDQVFEQLKCSLDSRTLGLALEESLFSCHAEANECGPQYKTKFRSIQFNLKDETNMGLRMKLFGPRPSLSFDEFVRLSPEAMNEKLQAQAEEALQASLKHVFKPTRRLGFGRKEASTKVFTSN